MTRGIRREAPATRLGKDVGGLEKANKILFSPERVDLIKDEFAYGHWQPAVLEKESGRVEPSPIPSNSQVMFE
jgi:hypothetical protein